MPKTATIVGRGHRSFSLLNLLGSFFWIYSNLLASFFWSYFDKKDNRYIDLETLQRSNSTSKCISDGMSVIRNFHLQ